jgi:hypothetical protein
VKDTASRQCAVFQFLVKIWWTRRDSSRRPPRCEDVGNPIRHSVATTYVKRACSQMENLENQLIISCPTRFRPDEIAKGKEATTRTGDLCRDREPNNGSFIVGIPSGRIICRPTLGCKHVAGAETDNPYALVHVLPVSSSLACPKFLGPHLGFSCHLFPSLVERRELCRYMSGAVGVARLARCPIRLSPRSTPESDQPSKRASPLWFGKGLRRL